MKNKVLVIDNYDSFTYNLVHYMEDLDFDVTVVRNDEFSMDFVENFDKILISPGPGEPTFTSLNSKTSGPPCLLIIIDFAILTYINSSWHQKQDFFIQTN